MSFTTPNQRTVKPAIAILLIIIALGIGVVYAILSFTQTSTTTIIPPPPPAPALTPLCSTLANFTSPTSGTGSVAYSCTGQTSAFTAMNGPVTSTPIIHGLSTGLSLAFYTGSQSLNPCPGSSLSANILNNTSMRIGDGAYNYCVFYNGLSTSLTFTFSVTWN